MKFNEMVKAQSYIGHFDTLIPMKSGRIVGVDKRRLNETPFFLLTNPPNNSVVVGAGVSSSAVAMRLAGEGPMQLIMLGWTNSLNNSLVRLYTRDGNQPAMLMNNPIYAQTMLGLGGTMYPLPEALYVDEDRALTVIFTDLSGDGGNQRICAVGAKYSQLQADPSLEKVKNRLKDSEFTSLPYWYTLDKTSVALTAFGSSQQQITIDNAHNFEIHQISVASTGDFSLDIIDLTKGESILNAPRGTHYEVPASLFCGSGSYPYRFHEPVMVFGGQRLLVNLTDLSGAPNTVYLTLGGKAVKIRKWA